MLPLILGYRRKLRALNYTNNTDKYIGWEKLRASFRLNYFCLTWDTLRTVRPIPAATVNWHLPHWMIIFIVLHICNEKQMLLTSRQSKICFKKFSKGQLVHSFLEIKQWTQSHTKYAQPHVCIHALPHPTPQPPFKFTPLSSLQFCLGLFLKSSVAFPLFKTSGFVLARSSRRKLQFKIMKTISLLLLIFCFNHSTR